MNSIFTIRSTPFTRTTVFFILVVLLSQLALPILGQGVAEAQFVDPACASQGRETIDNGNGTFTCGSAADQTAVSQQAAAVAGTGDGNGGVTAGNKSCSPWWMFLANFLVCGGRSIAVWSGAAMIWISGWFLGAAGVIFNWGIENTVVNFNGVVYTNVAGGIQAVWTAFRDISNILIIGILVFVAIEMILGTSAFGGKKTVAKVLVIAILINFSLLFSRMIVETANFVSGQFYKAVQFQTSGGSGGAISTVAGSNAVNQYASGISGRFAQLMGVTGFASSGEALWKTAEDPKNGGFIALGQGVLTALIFLAAAAVFLYGTFLMISRAILLTFLIMTSSLAFASYLLPKNLTGNYGWSAWWKALLQSAVFGPLLLIFLWATLKVAEGVARIPGTGEIGTLISSPADIGGIAALFGYLIILGMLFASIKIASSFASGIAGFDYAKMVPGIGLGLGGIAAGMLGRNTLGWGASAARVGLRRFYNRPDERDEQGNLISYEGRRTGIAGLANRAALRTARRLGSATFNPLQTKTAGMTASALGIPKLLASKKPGEGGHEGVMGRKARAADEIARDIGPTSAQQEAIRRQHAEQARLMQQTVEQQRTQLATLQQTTLEAARQRQPDRGPAQRELQDARTALSQEERNRRESEGARARELRESRDDEAATARLRAAHEEEMSAETERIRRAQDLISQREQRVNALDEQAQTEAAAEIAPQVAALNEAIREGGRQRDAFVQRNPVHEANVALRQSLLWDPRAAEHVEGAMRNHERDDNLRRLRAMINEGQPPAQQPQRQPQQGGGAH